VNDCDVVVWAEELVVVVVVVELGVLLVVVLGEVEEVVANVEDVVLEAGADVVDVETVELVVEPVVEGELLDSAKYAAAPATATTTMIITARKAVAMPLEEACK